MHDARGMRTVVGTLLASSLLIACAAEPSEQGDELAGESANDDDGKHDGAGYYGYFAIRTDDAAGQGYVVSMVNRTSITCADDSKAAECHVDAIEWSATQIGSTARAAYEKAIAAGEPLLLQGDIVVEDFNPNSMFDVNNVWIGANKDAVADGVYVMAKDNNIRCITAPCPNIDETRLNANRSAAISEVDLDASGADQLTIELALHHLTTTGVIVAGDRYYYSGGDGKGRRATQFYTRALVPRDL
jgi:hypothetical protein